MRHLSLLKRQKKRAKGLVQQKQPSEDDVNAWVTTTREVLKRIFGAHHPNILAVLHDGYYFRQAGKIPPEGVEYAIREDLKKSIKMLDSCIEQVKELGPSSTVDDLEKGAVAYGRRVFIVHGHDESKKEAVARLLEKLELEPVILHEQPNLGLTLIEKFEHYSDVGFAVVMLTGDDVGKASAYSGEPYPRARQNVIFELGYFVGRLGRNRVCALYQRDIELPSDYEGIVYILLDEGVAWKMSLAREIKAAGIEVDANRAL